MAWELKIGKARNGFILFMKEEIVDEENKPSEIENEIVIEDNSELEGEEHQQEVDTSVRMLSEVAEYFGLNGSKHDKYRLSIKSEKQDVK